MDGWIDVSFSSIVRLTLTPEAEPARVMGRVNG